MDIRLDAYKQATTDAGDGVLKKSVSDNRTYKRMTLSNKYVYMFSHKPSPLFCCSSSSSVLRATSQHSVHHCIVTIFAVWLLYYSRIRMGWLTQALVELPTYHRSPSPSLSHYCPLVLLYDGAQTAGSSSPGPRHEDGWIFLGGTSWLIQVP